MIAGKGLKLIVCSVVEMTLLRKFMYCFVFMFAHLTTSEAKVILLKATTVLIFLVQLMPST